MRQLTVIEFSSMLPGQMGPLDMRWKLCGEQNGVLPSFHINIASSNYFDDNKHGKGNGLNSLMVRLYDSKRQCFQDSEKVVIPPVEQPIPSNALIFPLNPRTGRPYRKPTFSIKAIWCKTVICLMDMECDLPKRLDYGVSPLHGLPKYLVSFIGICLD